MQERFRGMMIGTVLVAVLMGLSGCGETYVPRNIAMGVITKDI